MRTKRSLLFIASLSIFILLLNAFVPFTDSSLIYADGSGGNPPPPKDTTGNHSILNPDSTIVVLNPDYEMSLFDIVKLLFITL